MNIYEYLTNDHQKVKALFTELTLDKSTEEKEQLFSVIKRELLTHSKIEDETIYSALLESNASRDEGLEAEDEHAIVKELLARLDEDEVGSPNWMKHLDVLKTKVLHHIDEEEDVLFPDVKKLISEQQEDEFIEQVGRIKRMIIEEEMLVEEK